jgi:hypothetical protein
MVFLIEGDQAVGISAPKLFNSEQSQFGCLLYYLS